MDYRRISWISPKSFIYPNLIFSWALGVLWADWAFCWSISDWVFTSWTSIAHTIFFFFSHFAFSEVQCKWLKKIWKFYIKGLFQFIIINITWSYLILNCLSSWCNDESDVFKCSNSLNNCYICITNDFCPSWSSTSWNSKDWLRVGFDDFTKWIYKCIFHFHWSINCLTRNVSKCCRICQVDNFVWVTSFICSVNSWIV